MSNKRRVVITGMGALTPLGNNYQDTWENILAGESGIAPITHFDPVDIPVKIAGEVKGFDPTRAMTAKDSRKMGVFIRYGVDAAQQALDEASLLDESGLLDSTKVDAARCGVAVGAGIGGLADIVANADALREGGARRVSPFFIPGAIINMVAGMIAMRFICKGPNVSMVSACATGAHNIGTAYRMIQNCEADVMIAGGSEMATTPLGIAGFASARALSRRNDDPAAASRPWDRDRDGFVLAEGAGVFVLEDYEHAKARGAHIHAELLGFGMSDDAYHLTAPSPDGEGFVSCMQSALSDADLSPSDIQYVNVHGTSTMADVIEAKAVADLFQSSSDDLMLSSTKSMTGHMLGATGAVEAMFGVLAIRDQVAPPTINLDNVDDKAPALNYVPHKPQKGKIQAVLSNSFGFGGTNTTLIVGACT